MYIVPSEIVIRGGSLRFRLLASFYSMITRQKLKARTPHIHTHAAPVARSVHQFLIQSRDASESDICHALGNSLWLVDVWP